MAKEKQICCICGKEFEGWGCDPWPIKEDGECCAVCNMTKVVPERIRRLNERERFDLQCEIDETMADNIGF